MIDAKQAVHTAISHIGGFFPTAKDIRLEEIEYAGNWKVVVSFESGTPTTLAQVMGGSNRLYKTLNIDPDNGDFISMKVWRQ